MAIFDIFKYTENITLKSDQNFSKKIVPTQIIIEYSIMNSDGPGCKFFSYWSLKKLFCYVIKNVANTKILLDTAELEQCHIISQKLVVKAKISSL